MIKKRAMVGLVLAILLVVLSVGGFARAAGSPQITRWVFGAGGGSVQSGGVALDGTIGQAVVGSSTSNDIELCSGFWGCSGITASTAIYLPIVLKLN